MEPAVVHKNVINYGLERHNYMDKFIAFCLLFFVGYCLFAGYVIMLSLSNVNFMTIVGG